MLYVDYTNWGPRPLRLMKCWAEFNGYAEFVRDKLNSFQLGWMGLSCFENEVKNDQREFKRLASTTFKKH